MKLLIECIIANALLTVFVWVGSKDDKTKLKGFYYYPKEVQERLQSIPEYTEYIPKGSAKLINFAASFVVFVIIFAICSYINSAYSFTRHLLTQLFWVLL